MFHNSLCPSPSPSNKAGWAFTENCTGIICNHTWRKNWNLFEPLTCTTLYYASYDQCLWGVFSLFRRWLWWSAWFVPRWKFHIDPRGGGSGRLQPTVEVCLDVTSPISRSTAECQSSSEERWRQGSRDGFAGWEEIWVPGWNKPCGWRERCTWDGRWRGSRRWWTFESCYSCKSDRSSSLWVGFDAEKW